MVSINTSLAINAGTSRTIGKVIVLHSTDDLEATAKNMATFEHRVWRSAQTFVHYGVDDQGAYQVGQPGYVAWGAGNINRYAPVQIELCEFSNRDRAMKAYRNWIELAVTMADKFGVPRTLDDGNKTAGFKTHLWASRTYGGSDHGDPYPWLTKLGISKAQLAADLKAGKTAAIKTPTAPASQPAAKSSNGIAVDGYWGKDLTRRLQQLYGTPVDGIVSSQWDWGNPGLTFGWQFVTPSYKVKGSILISKMQGGGDGKCGPDTIKRWQRIAGTPVDGKVSSGGSLLVKYMQRCVNAGKKPF
jgi:hypothetical protein